MDVHAKPAVLIGLERHLLPDTEREAVLHHLKACPLCVARREEIQAELAALDSPEPAPGPVGRHVSPGILAGFVAAREAIGADLALRVEQHIARCPRCREAAERAARPRPAPSTTVKRPIPLAPFLRFRRGVTVRDSDAAARGRGPSWWFLGRSSWPVLSGLVLAAIIVGILVPRWLAEREAARLLTVATPLRLLGDHGAITPSPAVSLAGDTPLALFIKLPVPPRRDGRYELRLSRAGGGELKRRIAGSAFDPSGTVTILVDPEALPAGEQVEVRVVALDGGAGAVVFADAFMVESAAPNPAGPR